MPCRIQKIILSVTLFMVLSPPLFSAETINFSKLNHESKIWKLDGTWDFYWQELLTPESQAPETAISIEVGREWNGQANPHEKKPFEAFGYGTYERRLTGLAWQREGYEFGIASSSSAYRAYLYPAHDPRRFVTIGNGVVGSTKETTIPSILPQFIHFFPSGPDEVWIIRVQVANFHDSKGGLWTLPTLSLGNTSSQIFHVGMAFSIAACGMALIIGFYNFMLFYRRREDKASLMLALFCLITCLRNLATTDVYAYLDPSQEAWIYHMKWLVEYIGILAALWSIAAFYFFAFETGKSSRIFYCASALSALGIVSIVVLPVHEFTRLLTVYQIICAISTYYVITLMIKCLLRKEEGARFLLLGGIVSVISMLYDVGISQGLLPLPYTNQFATVIFIFLYGQLIASRFSKAFRTSERLQKSLRDEVSLQTAEIRNVMDHIPQGLFVIDPQLRIKGQYARYLEDLFERKHLTGEAALDLIFEKSQDDKDIQSVVQSCLVAAMGESLPFWELNQHLLPKEVQRTQSNGMDQTIELNWHPIADASGNVSEVLVSVRDISEIKLLQKQSAEDRLRNDMILELIALKPEFFEEFWSYSTNLVKRLGPFLDRLNSLNPIETREVLQQIHAWKGLSRTANFRALTNAIHDLESRIASLRQDQQAGSYSCLDLWNTILGLLDTYHQQRLKIRQHSHGGRSKEQDSIRLSELLDDFHRDLASLAREFNVPSPDLVRPNLDFQLSNRAAMALKVALIQLGRNSLVHGIETPKERLAQGKSREGIITLAADTLQQGDIVLHYHDDGSGLCLQKIAAKAYEQGLVPEGESIHADAAIQIIQTPEFSTAEQLTQIAGRGMGMMAIARSIEELGGSFQIGKLEKLKHSPGYVPVAFTITLPASLIEQLPALRKSS